MKTLADEIDVAICTCCDRREKEIDYIRNVSRLVGLKTVIFIGGNGQNQDLKYDFIDNPNVQTYHNQYNFHRLAIKWAYEQNLRSALFLEDDITLTRDFWDVLRKVECPDDYDQINVGGVSDHPNREQHYEGSASNSFLFESSSLGGFYGALIPGRNLKLLHEETRFDGLRGSCDDMIGKDQSHGYKKYLLQPPVVVERDMISITHNQHYPRGIYHQARNEGRLFNDEEVYSK